MAMKRMRQQHVYLMRRRDGLMKIGMSIHPRLRRKQIEREWEEPITLLYYLEVDDARKIEKDLHEFYYEYHHYREWYANIPIDMVVRFPDIVRMLVNWERLYEPMWEEISASLARYRKEKLHEQQVDPKLVSAS